MSKTEKSHIVARTQTLVYRISTELSKLRQDKLNVVPRVLEAPQRARTRIAGREVVNLASNNYLGFADHPFIKERARSYLEEWGAGAGAVRNIAGTFSIHVQFERDLAAFKRSGSAIVFQSGFTANQGVLGGLLHEGDFVASDALNHASIIDGLRLAKAAKATFRHKDTGHLDEVLAGAKTDGLKLVVTDGVFSMAGDIAPLDRIMPVARRHGAVVCVDDAHGSGVLGAQGRGTADHFGFEGADDLIQVGTLSKAWGTVGGYAAGPAGMSELLINRARSFIFTTAQPPAVVGAASAAIELVQREPEIIDRLWENTKYFRREINSLGFNTLGSETPIVPILFGETSAAFAASDMLLERGIFAVGVGMPIVPKGQARIRNIITAEHTIDDLDQALAAYLKVGKTLGMIR
jgi:glycine C-acetyltransferase